MTELHALSHPFLYALEYANYFQTDAHDVYGSSVAPSDFNTGELSESERDAVDVLDKAMECCRDSTVSAGREGEGRMYRGV